MANQKQGLDYFDLSVDFFDDDKIALMEAKYGIKGTYITLRLLAKLYRFGFYLQWGDDEAALFARSVGNGIQASLAKEVVDELVKRGFFDKAVLDSFHVLTSKGIQTRYFNAIKRRTPITVDARYLLVDVSKMQNVNIMYAESPKMYAESNIMYAESRQSRVEKSRVEKNTPPHPLSPTSGEQVGGGSRGGAFSVFLSSDMMKVRDMLTKAGVSEQDAWEYCRLVASPEMRDDFAMSTAKDYVSKTYAERQQHPFYEIIQALQRIDQQGKLHPMPYEDFQMHLYIHSLCNSDADAIYRAIGTPPSPLLIEELRSRIKEIKRPGSNIDMPAKFILAGIRKIKSQLK